MNSYFATSVIANVFYFHDNLHQVCRPEKGHKYSASFLKLDLDFGSKGRAPTLVKHSTAVPKRAQHSCFSSSYPFNLTPCTALMALWLLSHSLESTEWKGVFQGWDLPHQKPGPWMSTCISVFQSAHVLFLFIYNLVKGINLYTPIHPFPLCSISHWGIPSAFTTADGTMAMGSCEPKTTSHRLVLWRRLKNQHSFSCES